MDRLGNLEKAAPKSNQDSQGDHNTTTADLIAAPLTQALAKLAGQEDEKGKQLRPEYYVQSQLKDKQRDYTKMDTLDLFYGWLCVTDHLLTTGGDVHSYVSHIKYATEMLRSRKFLIRVQYGMTE